MKKKTRVTQKEFKAVVSSPVMDFNYVAHSLLSFIRRVNRGEKIHDEEMAMMHQTIDLICRPYKLN